MKKAIILCAILLTACLGGQAGLPTAISTKEILLPSPTRTAEKTQAEPTFTLTSSRTHKPTKTETAPPTRDPRTDNKYYLAECWNNAMSQSQMTECGVKQQQNSYQALQNLLEEIHQKMDAAIWADLAAVQRNWEVFRKGDCDIYLLIYEGGSIAPMMQQLCLDGHNQDRIMQLKYFVCDGNGMAGSCEESDKY